jgi:tRNA pseudouridine13 synthase
METEVTTELQLPPSKRIRIDAGETKGDSCSITTENIQDCNDFLTEKDVGITERINHIHQRIFGIIKQRFSDFIVHEISPSGHMAQLNNYNIPDSAHSSVGDLESLISRDDFMKIEALSKTNDKSLHEEINVKDCKESRTAIHKSIKKTFPKLDSRTIDKTTIRIFLRGYESSRRSNWNSQDGDYVKSVLYKENKDISTVINLLTKMLRIKSKGISFAGTKDKRAITSQYITFYRVSPSKLLTINGAELGIKLGNFELV